MPHESVKLVPGVNTTETPVLNQTGFSISNLVRFFYDTQQGALVQKLGGWAKYFPSAPPAPVRALWAWEDTNAVAHLGVGMQNIAGTFGAQLAAITNGSLSIITPQTVTDDLTLNQGGAPLVATTSGSAIVTVTDNTITGVTTYDSVYVPVHISVGGVILFGLYPCDPNGFISANAYTLSSADTLGNPLPATSTVTTPAGVSVASFATTSGSGVVTVTLANHGYSPGSTYPVLAETVVGGVTLFGNYVVQTVASASVFTILAANTASASASASINGGLARFIYSFGVGAIPSGTGYGVGGYGRGGYGTGTGVTPTTAATAISANNWTLDNWGQQLIACPISPAYALTPAGLTGTGATATVTFAQTLGAAIAVGEQMALSGWTPAALNGVQTVTASTVNSVSFASAVTAATQIGTLVWQNSPYQPIFVWDPTSGSPTATILPYASPVNDGIMVAMPQRQIVAWGSTFTGVQDPLLIRWCDVSNYNVWIGQVTNQAGSYRIPKGSRIVGCIQGPQQGLVWTDVALWSMQYIGLPYVYSFNEIDTGCGLIARKAACSLNGSVYWMGASQFFSLTANGVEPMPCPIWDVVFQQIDPANVDKIRVAVNSRFNEITWYLPTLSSGGEVAIYAKYNVALQVWDYGSLARSAWIDQSVLGAPIGADPNLLYIYQHEVSSATGLTLCDADTAPMLSSFQTGFFAMNEADVKVFVDQVWPDMKWGLFGGAQNATVTLTFYVCDYPGGPVSTYGPYPMTMNTQFLTPRFRGRLVSIALSSSDIGTFWRLGGIRYRGQQDGKY